MKRLFDITFSLVGLVLLFPVFVIVAILIKINSRGPIFFIQKRVGRHFRIFNIYKFRTMIEKEGLLITARGDARITNVGNFLRKTKIDELPQLFNVLKGDMSFVGPRPEVPYYVNMFAEDEKAILTVLPGITDWASLWDSDEGAILSGSPDPEKTYQEKIRPTKIRLQLKYVKENNFWIDMEIIFKTMKKLFQRVY